MKKQKMSLNYLLSATCAAITRCLSTTSKQLAQEQSRQRQYRLWPANENEDAGSQHVYVLVNSRGNEGGKDIGKTLNLENDDT